MRRSAFSSYKGKRHSKWVIVRRILIVLAVLALLFYSCYVFLQQFLVISSDGVHLDFSGLSSAKDKDADKDGSDSDEPPIIIDTADTPDKTEEDPVTEPAPPPGRILPETLRAVVLPCKRLSDSSYLDEVEKLFAGGHINAVVIDLKAPDGSLYYESAVAEAVQCGASNGAPDGVLAAAKRLDDAGICVIGRLSAFRDNTVPRQIRTLAVKTASGASWLDRNSYGWLNPYVDGSLTYLSSLIAELSAQDSFSELILDNFCFPTVGKTGLISYGDAQNKSRTASVSGSLEALLAAAGDTAISVKLTAKASESGEDTDAGQIITGLSASRRFYYDAASSDLTPYASASAAGGVPCVSAGKSAAAPLTTALSDSGFVIYRENGSYTAADFAA